MLDYGNLRDKFKSADEIQSQNLVIAEWNMNKYQTISQYGIYTSLPPHSSFYSPTAPNISSGENHLIYADGTDKISAEQEYFSDLSSIFKPNRPDPGIILTQKFGNMLITPDIGNIKSEKLSVLNPRYYLFSENSPYDYFNSAKALKPNSGDFVYGVSNPITGSIRGASPFIVYEDEFPCNKIVVKLQNHISVPEKFSIEILVDGSWETAYDQSSSSSADFATGIFNIYYNNGSWEKVEQGTLVSDYLVDDITQLTSASPTELIYISGVRLTVSKMTRVINQNNGVRYPASLEIIELSPRLEMDVTPYTEGFNFTSNLSDATGFGLPVGGIVSSTGQISMSNEENLFLFSSTLASLRMLSPDVKFSFFQLVDINNTNQAVPLKVMYSNNWSVGDDYSTTIDLEDGFKFLRELAAPDLLFQSSLGTRLSNCILFTLDNVGVTGLEFKKSINSADKEDIRIRNFFCKKEQTVLEVLEELAISTQCSMYFDAVGRLNVLTKERLTEKVGPTESTESIRGTDFWMVFDEDYLISGSQVDEFPYISNYSSNVINYSEDRIRPMTDGNIVYHMYGPRKQPRLDELPENVIKNITNETTFPMSLAFANYGYSTRILWEPGSDQDGTMGAANLEKDMTDSRVRNIFTASYTAYNEDDAVRKIYSQATPVQKQSMIIKIDSNEGLTFPQYKGTVLIDSEFIRYNGKLFSISNVNATSAGGNIKILFSEEELQETIRNIGPGSSIRLIGLVVDMSFKILGQDGDKYVYKVVGDGRAKLGSKVSKHFAFTENDDGLGQKYSIRLGSSVNNPPPGRIKTETKFDFLQRSRYKNAYRNLQKSGFASSFDPYSYLGFLRAEGAKRSIDLSNIDLLFSGQSASAGAALDRVNKQVDNSVPGDFDDYIFLDGERDIYAQKIELPFYPSIINTRMRLYSPRKRGQNGSQVMETLSSIAGIAFNVNAHGEGYYLEVEGVGSGKSSVANEAFKQNLRFYKVFKNKDGRLEPKLIESAPVAAFTVSNFDVQVIKNERTSDPVFELTIVIDKTPNKGNIFTVRYGDTVVSRFAEPKNERIFKVNDSDSVQNVAIFVRNDSQAIYEYISAAERPLDKSDKGFFKVYNKIDDKVRAGIIPVSQQFLLKRDDLQYYFNDFARLVREVKEFDVRFEYPSFASTLIDVSKITSNYFIKKYSATSFGAKLVVANTSAGPALLSAETNNPLYIVGISLEEISTGSINMEDIYDKTDEKRRFVTDRERNLAIFGPQTFNIDNTYMQSLSQANNMMRWVIKNCSRERIKFNMQIFPNPLLELGDKIKIYDKTRGYNENNDLFGEKTFTISSITHGNSFSGPTMSIELIEIGES